MAQHVPTAPARVGRAITARRWTVSVLHVLAEATDNLTVAAAASLAATSMFEFGPQWAQLTSAFDLTLALLALYGAARLIGPGLTGLANTMDPDLHDGHDLREAARLINQTWQDLTAGADRDDVLRNLHIATLPEQLAGLLEELAKEEPEDTKVRLWDAADQLRAVARTLTPQQ
ncbi:hypothetical protein [Streptomyces triticirhizae]|uniref:Uncharacterized protein n=1 Tax=Streptomyces triticirhizae TaxID=2483353 RepID=A0A3M2LQJ1_9ACTN|nr:hypothetical protein [Streptomyces triticirhizae]RMI39754.1 hypothetical protein EBN88_14280 [Streptomyces triticirhizae]